MVRGKVTWTTTGTRTTHPRPDPCRHREARCNRASRPQGWHSGGGHPRAQTPDSGKGEGRCGAGLAVARRNPDPLGRTGAAGPTAPRSRPQPALPNPPSQPRAGRLGEVSLQGQQEGSRRLRHGPRHQARRGDRAAGPYSGRPKSANTTKRRSPLVHPARLPLPTLCDDRTSSL